MAIKLYGGRELEQKDFGLMTTKELGRAGEAIAAMFLESRGYTILTCNWVTRHGEVDIVAARGGEPVLVEVKTRRVHDVNEVAPELAVNERKQRRYLSMGDTFLMLHPEYFYVRLDVIGVTIADDVIRIHHIPDAYGQDGSL